MTNMVKEQVRYTTRSLQGRVAAQFGESCGLAEPGVRAQSSAAAVGLGQFVHGRS